MHRSDLTGFAAHLEYVKKCASAALTANKFDRLVIGAGVEKFSFLDDHPYPFIANPHFKWWLPQAAHPHCWLAFTPGERPVLAYYQPEDYWHLPPAPPQGAWTELFEIHLIRMPEEAAAVIGNRPRDAVIAEVDAAIPGLVINNPQAVVDHLHWHRACKTGFELDCMRAASRRAVRGHRAAEQAFRNGGSEHDIHRAYLDASEHSDLDLPYANIVALGEHAAILHYQHQSRTRPDTVHSLLIDAGAQVDGYAADITRTHTTETGAFADLIAAVDAVQRQLASSVRAGVDYRELHLQAHLLLAGVLRAEGLARAEPVSLVETGISRAFFPHGLGHLIGLQVHDVAGLVGDERGTPIPRPEGHPHLRLTRRLLPGMVVTIEPGLYFIDSLLTPLRAGAHADMLDWTQIERLRAYGGIRIEDDVVCTDGEPENLTRDAFAAL